MVAGLAEEQADGGVVIGCLELGVHGGEVEVELAGVAGFDTCLPSIEQIEAELGRIGESD